MLENKLIPAIISLNYTCVVSPTTELTHCLRNLRQLTQAYAFTQKYLTQYCYVFARADIAV